MNEKNTKYVKLGDVLNVITNYKYPESMFYDIVNLPRENVAPIIYAKWIKYLDYKFEPSGYWMCSNCSKLSQNQTSYCPNCGATMLY